ncbi:protein WEAK CHLOROPLAST MOVEMENT UNDER BLUE LIGHT 1 [Gossypium raimondii]|nr:protein WEAK CHLOROPLAST MOVEMENT UNDER BLUE LIGHT 1 [Gossypium raimondii]
MVSVFLVSDTLSSSKMGNVKEEEMPRSEPVSLLVEMDHNSGKGPASNETKQPESHLSVIKGQGDSRTECADITSSVEIETDHQGRLMNESRTGGTHDNSDEEPSQSTGSNPMVGDSKNDHLEPARLSDGQQSQEANSVVNSLINNDNRKLLPSLSAHELKTSGLTLPLFDARSSPDGSPVMLDGAINDSKTGDAKNEDHVSQIADLTPHHRKMIRSAKSFSPSQKKQVDLKRDLLAPFESVKEAVSKFGGIVDWKAHRNRTLERSKLVEQMFVRVQKEKPEYKKRPEDAEEEKMNVLKELDSTKRQTEKLKLHLERAQTEENQAKQDYELAKFRVDEMEHGIGDEASVAARAQLEVAKSRHAAAVSELKFVKEKLETLNKEYAFLMNERDTAVKKAEEVVSASKEVEKMVEELTIELIATREILESAHAAHVEAEEKRIRVTLARDQDTKHWEKELKQVEEELQRLNQQIYSAKDLKSKIDFASALLLDLKAELASYKSQTSKTTTHIDVHAFVASLQKELEDAKVNIEKASAEVDCLKVATISLKLELDRNKSELANSKQREHMASSAVALSEAELATVTRVADEAKSLAEIAREDLHKAEEEAAQVKAGASAMESRLLAAEKEIEAAKASEKLALAAIEAFEKSESTKSIDNVDSPPGVTLSTEEYYNLGERANEAKEEAKLRVEAVVSQVEVAKQSESISLERLEEVSREMAVRKEALKVAMVKAEKARERKFGIEQEWRKWRGEPKATELSQGENPPRPSSEGKKETKNFKPNALASSKPCKQGNTTETESLPKPKLRKKKKSLLPKIFTFFSWKKSHSSASKSHVSRK